EVFMGPSSLSPSGRGGPAGKPASPPGRVRLLQLPGLLAGPLDQLGPVRLGVADDLAGGEHGRAIQLKVGDEVRGHRDVVQVAKAGLQVPERDDEFLARTLVVERLERLERIAQL